MPTPYEDLYAAAVAIVDTGATFESAPTNFDTDFRLTAAVYTYQVRIQPLPPRVLSNQTYPRAAITIDIHYPLTTFATEKTFAHSIIYTASALLFDHAQWEAEAGVYGFDLDEEPEMDEGAREGNVISFTFTAVVLMDPV